MDSAMLVLTGVWEYVLGCLLYELIHENKDTLLTPSLRRSQGNLENLGEIARLTWQWTWASNRATNASRRGTPP